MDFVYGGFGEFEALFGTVPAAIANVYPCDFSTKILPEAVGGFVSAVKHSGQRFIAGKFRLLFPRRP